MHVYSGEVALVGSAWGLLLVPAMELVHAAFAKSLALIWCHLRRNRESADSGIFLVASPNRSRWVFAYLLVVPGSILALLLRVWGSWELQAVLPTLLVLAFAIPVILRSRWWGVARITEVDLSVEWDDGTRIASSWRGIPNLRLLVGRSADVSASEQCGKWRRFEFMGSDAEEGHHLALRRWAESRGRDVTPRGGDEGYRVAPGQGVEASARGGAGLGPGRGGVGIRGLSFRVQGAAVVGMLVGTAVLTAVFLGIGDGTVGGSRQRVEALVRSADASLLLLVLLGVPALVRLGIGLLTLLIRKRVLTRALQAEGPGSTVEGLAEQAQVVRSRLRIAPWFAYMLVALTFAPLMLLDARLAVLFLGCGIAVAAWAPLAEVGVVRVGPDGLGLRWMCRPRMSFPWDDLAGLERVGRWVHLESSHGQKLSFVLAGPRRAGERLWGLMEASWRRGRTGRDTAQGATTDGEGS